MTSRAEIKKIRKEYAEKKKAPFEQNNRDVAFFFCI
jgi:hypothetical protein